MAKIEFDPVAVRVEELLSARKREEAIALVLETLAAGEAKAYTQQLAAKLFGAGRGRPKGLYMWIEIGQDNAVLDSDGKKYEDRLSTLAEKYRRSKKHIERCIAQYEKARHPQ